MHWQKCKIICSYFSSHRKDRMKIENKGHTTAGFQKQIQNSEATKKTTEYDYNTRLMGEAHRCN